MNTKIANNIAGKNKIDVDDFIDQVTIIMKEGGDVKDYILNHLISMRDRVISQTIIECEEESDKIFEENVDDFLKDMKSEKSQKELEETIKPFFVKGFRDYKHQLLTNLKTDIEKMKRTPQEDDWSTVNVTLDDVLNLIKKLEDKK